MFHGTLTKKQRLDLYCRLPAIHKMMHTESGSSNGVVVEKKVRKMLERNPDGPPTVYNFWSGEVAIRATELGQEDTTKVYEYLALVSALMFTVSVAFYVENPGGPGTHFYGIVSCISNCALWMATLSSTLFTVVIHSLRSDEQLELLVDLFGPCLMRVPMMLFVWGTALIFIQFVLFFKISVDPGFPCTMCLTMCFLSPRCSSTRCTRCPGPSPSSASRRTTTSEGITTGAAERTRGTSKQPWSRTPSRRVGSA